MMRRIWLLMFLFALPVAAQVSSRPGTTPERAAPTNEHDVGGLVDVRSPTCGMTGNGTTDDTTAFQNCVTYAMNHYQSLYLPTPSKCYLITKSINATSTRYPTSFWITGDTPENSRICDGLTEPYPVIDFGGCTYCGVRNISIIGQGHNYSGTKSTAGILASQGSGNGTGGGVFRIENSIIDTGATSGTAGAVIYGADLSGCWNSRISSFGVGLVIGNGLGVWKGKSKFYTLHRTGNSDTQEILDGCGTAGRYNPALQLTGSDVYTINNGYYVIMAPGTGSPTDKVIEISDSSGLGDWIFAFNIRTENQTGGSAKGACALYLNRTSLGGFISGALGTDNGGWAICGATGAGLTNYNIIAYGGGHAQNGGGFFRLSSLKSTTADIWAANFGTISGTNNSSNRIVLADSENASALIANNHLTSTMVCVHGACTYSDLDVNGGTRFNGNVSLSAGNGGLKLKDQGQCTMRYGACPAQSLGHTYAAAPQCFWSWTGRGILTGQVKMLTSLSAVTPTSTVNRDTAEVNWICYGN